MLNGAYHVIYTAPIVVGEPRAVPRAALQMHRYDGPIGDAVDPAAPHTATPPPEPPASVRAIADQSRLAVQIRQSSGPRPPPPSPPGWPKKAIASAPVPAPIAEASAAAAPSPPFRRPPSTPPEGTGAPGAAPVWTGAYAEEVDEGATAAEPLIDLGPGSSGPPASTTATSVPFPGIPTPPTPSPAPASTAFPGVAVQAGRVHFAGGAAEAGAEPLPPAPPPLNAPPPSPSSAPCSFAPAQAQATAASAQSSDVADPRDNPWGGLVE